MIVNKTTQINVGDTPINTVYQGETEIWSYFPYTRLNYLESNGNQWIDSGFTPTSGPVTVKIKFNHRRNGQTARAVMGNYNEEHTPYYKTVATPHGGKYYFSNYEPSNYTYTFDTIHEMEFNVVPGTDNNRNGTFAIYENGNLIGSGNHVGDYMPTNYPLTSIYIFTQHNGYRTEMPTATARIYYLQIYYNNKLVRDFVPVLDANNVPCLYDKANRQLYYNQGTGQFLYG